MRHLREEQLRSRDRVLERVVRPIAGQSVTVSAVEEPKVVRPDLRLESTQSLPLDLESVDDIDRWPESPEALGRRFEEAALYPSEVGKNGPTRHLLEHGREYVREFLSLLGTIVRDPVDDHRLPGNGQGGAHDVMTVFGQDDATGADHGVSDREDRVAPEIQPGGLQIQCEKLDR